MWPYRFGIEEEYFITDVRTGNARRTLSRRFFRACQKDLGDAVTNELLQSQIEVRTPPNTTMAEGREHLRRYRSTLMWRAAGHGAGIIASGTHPLASWKDQKRTPKERYDRVTDDLQMLARRNLLCGLHVHVEAPDPTARVGIMRRMMPFLPPLLALSTSSPFWQGQRTGLLSYPHDGIP